MMNSDILANPVFRCDYMAYAEALFPVFRPTVLKTCIGFSSLALHTNPSRKPKTLNP